MAASKATLKLIAAAKKQAGGKKKSKRSKKSVTLSKGEVFKALELVNQVNREIGRVIGCGVGAGKKGGGKKKRSSKKRASKKVGGYIKGPNAFPFLTAPKKTRKKAGKKRSKKVGSRKKVSKVTFVGLAKKTKKRRSKKS